MKLTATIAFSLSLLFMALGWNDANSAPKSYPLMCRGGGTMTTVLRMSGIAIDFIGSTQGAAVRPPKAGECTWLDRGFRPGEPTKVEWVVNRVRSGRLWDVKFDAQGKITGIKYTGTSDDVDSYNYLFNKIRNGEIFQLHAFLDTCSGGKKCSYLRSRRVGP